MIEQVKKFQRLRKIKAHVQANKTIYITGASCLVLGLVGGSMASSQTTVKQGADMWKLLQYKSPTVNNLEQTTVLVRRGHPGNIVKCLETGEVFASQRRAADALGINPGTLSKHLKGAHPSAGGYTFENLGEAS